MNYSTVVAVPPNNARADLKRLPNGESSYVFPGQERVYKAKISIIPSPVAADAISGKGRNAELFGGLRGWQNVDSGN